MIQRSKMSPINEPFRSPPPPRVHAVLILAGALRTPPLARLSPVNALDYALTPDRTVLDLWLRNLARTGWEEPPEVRVLHGGAEPPPAQREGSTVRLVADRAPYRGPAGIVRDACLDDPDDGLLLVVEGARRWHSGLDALVRRHAAADADLTLGVNPDGSPAGAYVFRRRWLDLVPEAGFVDLKEQRIGRLRGRGGRLVAHRLGRPSVSLRTGCGPLAATRAERARKASAAAASSAAERTPRPTPPSATPCSWTAPPSAPAPSSSAASSCPADAWRRARTPSNASSARRPKRPRSDRFPTTAARSCKPSHTAHDDGVFTAAA